MIVEARVVGQRSEIADREVTVAPGDSMSLRRLLSDVVAVELAEYAERQRQLSLLRVLTPADLAIGSQTGRYRAEPRVGQPPPSLAEAVDRAIEGFTDGVYYVFLDNEQVEDLDAALTISPSSRLRFVRLVALAGG